MGRFIPVGMRAKVPDDGIVVNTCSDNDTKLLGDEHRWSWSNPTNRTFRVRHSRDNTCNAVSVECLWQGTKMRAGMQEPDKEVLEGNWRKAKGKKPIGAWGGRDLPLITTPGEARRAIYIPAFAYQIHSMLTRRDLLQLVRNAVEDPRPVYLRDFDTGQGIDRNGPMSHAWLLSMILNGDAAELKVTDEWATIYINRIVEMVHRPS